MVAIGLQVEYDYHYILLLIIAIIRREVVRSLQRHLFMAGYDAWNGVVFGLLLTWRQRLAFVNLSSNTH